MPPPPPPRSPATRATTPRDTPPPPVPRRLALLLAQLAAVRPAGATPTLPVPATGWSYADTASWGRTWPACGPDTRSGTPFPLGPPLTPAPARRLVPAYRAASFIATSPSSVNTIFGVPPAGTIDPASGAAGGVTVVDDGSLVGRRGSLSIDDEGTPTQETVLIEDGILKGYIHDRLNARLMGVAPTGNGRRESYAHAPMPRMTNTFMKGGHDDPAELLARVKNGIFAKSFGGGQVDIVSGKFVFSCTEAYKIENGRLGAPIKGATLIGDGPSVLTRVVGIGNDMALDEGVGVCGKGGQSVPAGVGQPTLLVEGLTVGGTA